MDRWRYDDAFPDPAEHAPRRPGWQCATEGRPWPCPAARRRLAAEHGPVGLATRLSTLLIEAARDMPDTPASELHDRFVSWTWAEDDARAVEVLRVAQAAVPGYRPGEDE